MPLLAPLFLLGLAAVAVPLLVHLVQREKRDPVAFPSMMFLERTPAPFTSRRHIRDPWLFALRALAIALLAIAFARPVLGRRAAAGGADVRRRDLVILLDRSFSMRAGQRFSRARTAVDSVIGTMASGDRATLVPFDRLAAAVTPMTSDAAQLRTALATLAPTDESTRLSPAIAAAAQRLAASDAPRKVVVVISDFQRTAWDLTDDATLPPGVEVLPVDVAGSAPAIDHAVRSVEVRDDRRGENPRVVVSARLSNAGPALAGVAARLEVGGRVVQERRVDLPRDGGASVTFDAIPVTPDAVPARVTLAPDALPGDDAYHFLLDQPAALGVLVVEAAPSAYVARALAIGDAPHFGVSVRSPSRVSATDLARRQLVVLPDGAFPVGLGAARLLSFVQQGGGLLLALGDAANARAWAGAARALVPGTIRGTTDPAAVEGAVLGSLDERHPALALLAGPRAGDLVSARFHRYRAIDTTAGILARFDDGAPALVEHTVGRGRVITFGSSLDGVWNDLPRQPAFLPLLQELSRYAAAWREAPHAIAVGASVRPADLPAAAGVVAPRWNVTAPSGARSTVGGEGGAAALVPGEAGVHELRPGGAPGARPVLVAANIAPTELEMATFEPLRLVTTLTSAPGRETVAATVQEESLADREARQSSWWYLLLAAALLLLAETVVARRALTPAPVVE